MRNVARGEDCGLLRLQGGGVPRVVCQGGLPQVNGVLGGRRGGEEGVTPQFEHRGRVRRRTPKGRGRSLGVIGRILYITLCQVC